MAAQSIARRKSPGSLIGGVKPGGYQGLQMSPAAPGQYQAKVASVMQKPAAPGAAVPGVPAAAPARATPNPTADPEYTQGIGALLQDIATQRAALGLDASRDHQDLATTLQRMGLAQKNDLGDADKNANRQGLLYSGILDKRRADVTRDYGEREGDARLAGQRRDEDRQAAQDALGEIVPDATSPLGYRATGQAGQHLLELYRSVLARQLATDGALTA